MSADLRGSSGDAPHHAGQPRPADQQRPTDQPRGADQRPVPPVVDRAGGEEARRQKYAHLTDGSGQVPSRPGTPARHAGESGQAPSPEARQPQTRPPEAHVLSDRRYQTLEEYQKARNATPPAGQADHSQGKDAPRAAGKPPAADMAQGAAHASGTGHRGAQPSPEVSRRQPAEQGRPADSGRQPGGAAITHLHWQYQGTNTDVYTDGTRSAHVYSPTGPLSPDGADSAGPSSARDGTAKGGAAALPGVVARYLSTGDHQVGIPAVGDKPDKSPGDTSDLPPDGGKLLEPDDSKKSRMARFREAAESPEVLGDLPDAVAAQGDAWQNALASMPSEGGTVQVVHDHPLATNTPADHATVGDIASTGVMLGIVLFEGGRWLSNHLGHRKEEVT